MPRGFVCKGFKKKSRFFHQGDGYYYHRNRLLRPGVWSCRCANWYRLKCKGRAVISADLEQFDVTQPHSYWCEADVSVWKARHLRRAIIKRCKTRDPKRAVKVIEEESVGYSRAVKMRCSSKILRSAIHRARIGVFGKIPEDLSALDAMLRSNNFKHLTETESSGLMYAGRCGSSATKSRCLIFMSPCMKALMGRVKKVFSDATWDGRPAKPSCSQVFSITTSVLSQVTPLCIVLMESKSLRTYKLLLQSIKHLVPDFQPNTINCDFESAEVRAWSEEFPTARIQGCLYHYANNVSQYAKSLHYHNLIMNDPTFNSLVRSCLAIPLVHEDRLKEALACVMRRARDSGHSAILDRFFQYIYNEYLVKRKTVLSVHLADDRTNNISECWNRMLQVIMEVTRPNIFIFLAGLVRLEERFVQNMYSLVRGETTTRGRRISAIENDSRLRNLTLILDANILTMDTFLRRASMRLIAPYRRAFPPPEL